MLIGNGFIINVSNELIDKYFIAFSVSNMININMISILENILCC